MPPPASIAISGRSVGTKYQRAVGTDFVTWAASYSRFSAIVRWVRLLRGAEVSRGRPAGELDMIVRFLVAPRGVKQRVGLPDVRTWTSISPRANLPARPCCVNAGPARRQGKPPGDADSRPREPHPFFEARDNASTRVPVTLKMRLFGGNIRLPTVGVR